MSLVKRDAEELIAVLDSQARLILVSHQDSHGSRTTRTSKPSCASVDKNHLQAELVSRNLKIENLIAMIISDGSSVFLVVPQSGRRDVYKEEYDKII